MSKTLKQRKWYSISTKHGECISSLRTTPDYLINSPLHLFYINPKTLRVEHVGGQPCFPMSKHSSIPLLSLELIQNIPTKEGYRIVIRACEDNQVEELLKHYNRPLDAFYF